MLSSYSTEETVGIPFSLLATENLLNLFIYSAFSLPQIKSMSRDLGKDGFSTAFFLIYIKNIMLSGKECCQRWQNECV